jgi:hypothetical protein
MNCIDNDLTWKLRYVWVNSISLKRVGRDAHFWRPFLATLLVRGDYINPGRRRASNHVASTRGDDDARHL